MRQALPAVGTSPAWARLAVPRKENPMQTKWLVLCGVLGVALLGLVVAAQGLTMWTGLLALVLLVCPLLVAWVMRQTRESTRRHE